MTTELQPPVAAEQENRIVAELKKTFAVFLYLALFLGAFTTYRRLLLAEYQVSYLHYGCSLVEALVLAKIIVVGDMLRIGEGWHDRPLILAVLNKMFWFSLLILAFSLLEHLVVGWLRGRGPAAVVQEVLDRGLWELLAQTLVKVLALLPLFAVWEIGRVLGPGKLFELFFRRGNRPLP